jgi:tetratricopeptide (TPR) repeat protein
VANFKLADLYKKSGQKELAAQTYLKAEKLSRKTDTKAKALYDAATMQLTQNEWQKALPLLNKFIKKYKNHSLIRQAYEKLIVCNQSLGRALDAAEIMMIAGRSEPDLTKKRNLLWTAANIFKNESSNDKAFVAFKAHLATFNKPDLAALESMYQLSVINQKRKNIRERNKRYRQIIRYIDSSSLKDTDRGRFLAAQVSFVLAEYKFKKFNSVSLTLPLKKSLKRKQKAMKRALNAYEKIVDYGVAEYSTASTHRIAEIYADLGRSVLNSSRPKGLSREEEEMYALQLEEQAFPFEEKAIELFEVNAKRVKDGFYDDWIKESFASLKQLQPVRYAKEERTENVFEKIF